MRARSIALLLITGGTILVASGVTVAGVGFYLGTMVAPPPDDALNELFADDGNSASNEASVSAEDLAGLTAETAGNDPIGINGNSLDSGNAIAGTADDGTSSDQMATTDRAAAPVAAPAGAGQGSSVGSDGKAKPAMVPPQAQPRLPQPDVPDRRETRDMKAAVAPRVPDRSAATTRDRGAMARPEIAMPPPLEQPRLKKPGIAAQRPQPTPSPAPRATTRPADITTARPRRPAPAADSPAAAPPRGGLRITRSGILPGLGANDVILGRCGATAPESRAAIRSALEYARETGVPACFDVLQDGERVDGFAVRVPASGTP